MSVPLNQWHLSNSRRDRWTVVVIVIAVIFLKPAAEATSTYANIAALLSACLGCRGLLGGQRASRALAT